MDKLREEFEQWFKFHSDEEECTNLLQMNNAGTNYLHPHTDLAWIAWQASRASIVVELPDLERYYAGKAAHTRVYSAHAFRNDVEKNLRAIGLSIKGE
ncbi:MAG: hypothetical protein ACRC2L_14885 [Serratia nevei]